jgi:hypothetical protein
MRIVTCSVWAAYFNDLLRFAIYEVRIITTYALATVLRNKAETPQMFSYHCFIDGGGWNPTAVFGHNPKTPFLNSDLSSGRQRSYIAGRVLQTNAATNVTMRADNIIASRPKREPLADFHRHIASIVPEMLLSLGFCVAVPAA